MAAARRASIASQPLFAILAMVPIFSLAGVPPFSGFLGKLAIVEGLSARARTGSEPSLLARWPADAVLDGDDVVGRVLEAGRRDADRTSPGRALLVTIAGLSVVTLAMTFSAEPLFGLALARGTTVASARRVRAGRAGRTV